MFGLLKLTKSISKATYRLSHQLLRLASGLKLFENKHYVLVSIPSREQIQI